MQHYFRHHQGVRARFDGVNVSEETDKAGLLVAAMAAQKLRSLEDNSFETEMEQERFWKNQKLWTTSQRPH